MPRRLLLPVLSLLTAAGAAAEEPSPAPTPAPASTTPPAAASPDASLPAATPEAPVLPPATTSSGIGRVLGGMASVAAGYDSNVILSPSNNPTPTQKSSLALGADAAATLRLVDEGDHGIWQEGDHGERLRLTVDGMIRDYPSVSDAQLIRGGIHAVGHERASWGDPGFVVGYNHYDIDRKNAADAANGDLFASHVDHSYRQVDVGLVGAEWLRYYQEPDKTGVYGTVGWNHWYLLGEQADVHRRVEGGLAADVDHARTADNSFWGIIPSVGGRWRVGNGEHLGTYDGGLTVSYEARRYGKEDGMTAEHQGIAAANLTLDAWLCPNASAGLYYIWTHRSSNFTVDRYDRQQVGLRVTSSF